MAATVSGILLTGTHASRPAASAVSAGTVYSCTTHSLIYQSDGSATWSTWGTLGGAAAVNYVLVRDEKAQATDGGTFTSGAWQTRVLNTESADTGSVCSLASNQLTLTAGTYRCYASAPAYKTDRHQLRLQNVTDATTLLVGQSGFADNAGGGFDRAQLMGRFTIAASKAIELQHRCQTTQATNGFGVNSNLTTEVYAMIELWQE